MEVLVTPKDRSAHLDPCFPLEALPPRARNALLAEFGGRSPSIREVGEVPIKRWSLTPNIGETSIAVIRSIVNRELERPTPTALTQLSDAELMSRLLHIQGELRILVNDIKKRTRALSRSSDDKQHVTANARNTTTVPPSWNW
jgi:hypothetical protein